MAKDQTFCALTSVSNEVIQGAAASLGVSLDALGEVGTLTDKDVTKATQFARLDLKDAQSATEHKLYKLECELKEWPRDVADVGMDYTKHRDVCAEVVKRSKPLST
eukprot:gnl/Chilomastix_cuspidata/4574.p6 GENE.gnl/Chilomastix_cuspidata/4574~~gnl/Chilomastix_cuspidata/4574.p6  ORF type:complete len:106 (+),score=12.40 gnl/Chilomastix_cuspidata/4574:1539-1856(+)